MVVTVLRIDFGIVAFRSNKHQPVRGNPQELCTGGYDDKLVHYLANILFSRANCNTCFALLYEVKKKGMKWRVPYSLKLIFTLENIRFEGWILSCIFVSKDTLPHGVNNSFKHITFY